MADKLEFDISVESGIIIIDIHRSFDYENMSSFRKIIYRLARQNLKRIIINLSKLSFIDSTGIGGIIAAVRFIFQQGGNMQVVASSLRIRSIFERVKMDSVIPLVENNDIAKKEILEPSQKKLNITASLKKIEDFFNPKQFNREDNILTDRKYFHLKRDLLLYVDIIGKKTMQRKEGRLKRILEGGKGLVIKLKDDIKKDELKDMYCIISYFSNKQWFEFEDQPIRIDQRSLWFSYPRIVAAVERRSTLRVNINFPVSLQICDVIGTTELFEGNAINLGEGGLLIRMKESFPVCDCVGMQFNLPGSRHEIRLIGRVVRKIRSERNWYYLGVHFLIINEAARKQIGNFVQRNLTNAPQ